MAGKFDPTYFNATYFDTDTAPPATPGMGFGMRPQRRKRAVRRGPPRPKGKH